MSVLVNADTRVLVQGITGKEGSFQTRRCIEYGTKVVAGVTPGRGGETAEGVPVFNRVSHAAKETGAECALIFVPPPFAADAILEAARATGKESPARSMLAEEVGWHLQRYRELLPGAPALPQARASRR